MDKRGFTGIMGLAIVVSCAFAHSGAAKNRPWETKDWTEWTERDCVDVLWSSPWVKVGAYVFYDFDGLRGPALLRTHLTRFRSALPLRRAEARSRQLKRREWKPPFELDPKRVPGYDDGAEKLLDYDYRGPIVIHFLNSASDSWDLLPVGFVARLKLTDGREISPLNVTILRQEPTVEEFEAIFPRELDGELIIKPGDKEIKVMVGKVSGTKFKAKATFKFRLKDMTYNGKLEY